MWIVLSVELVSINAADLACGSFITVSFKEGCLGWPGHAVPIAATRWRRAAELRLCVHCRPNGRYCPPAGGSREGLRLCKLGLLEAGHGERVQTPLSPGAGGMRYPLTARVRMRRLSSLSPPHRSQRGPQRPGGRGWWRWKEHCHADGCVGDSRLSSLSPLLAMGLGLAVGLSC